MDKNFNKKVANATKWSAITEICAKLFLPISGLVLARILTPDAFGIVATLTMIISLADIFSDAGFHKYIVQHDFLDNDNLEKNATVAFWSNQTISFLLWFAIGISRHPLAKLVGSPGYGDVLLVSCANIPLVGFSSIQTAIFKRNMNFKALFKARIVALLVPLFITIPLAVVLRSFWALVIGTLSKNFINSIVLMYYSSWKPSFFYSIRILKEMISFSMWSMVETVSIWINQYLDVFFIGTSLSSYYLGLYKTSISIVGQILGLITAIITPVIFSTLSRLQNDDKNFREMFFKFQKVVALLVLPLGILVFGQKEIVTTILLGEQWIEASGFIGMWALCVAISVATTRYCSEMYRAKGRPLLCFLAQILMSIILIPGIVYMLNYGFKSLYIFRALVEIYFVLINIIITYYALEITPWQMVKNIVPTFFQGGIMLVIILLLKPVSENIIYQIIISIFGLVAYLIMVLLSRQNRELVLRYVFKKV